MIHAGFGLRFTIGAMATDWEKRRISLSHSHRLFCGDELFWSPVLTRAQTALGIGKGGLIDC